LLKATVLGVKTLCERRRLQSNGATRIGRMWRAPGEAVPSLKGKISPESIRKHSVLH